MFVVNLKLNLKKVLGICIVISVVSALLVEFLSSGHNTNSAAIMKKDEIKYDFVLTEENYLQILKETHENIPAAVNKTIKISGFVFRMDDFKENIFVCGRNTITNEEDTVAGFLCESVDASKLKDNEWVEITGIIKEGSYITTMPIIKVGTIQKIEAPSNTFVN